MLLSTLGRPSLRAVQAFRPVLVLMLATVLAGTACGADEDVPATTSGTAGAAGAGGSGAQGGCGPGALEVDGTCVPAGLPTGGCAPGEVSDEAHGCQPAGVPPASCGQGFEADGEDGCRPILPELPCASGTLAWPGETSCHEVAPCADGIWGDIPVEASTEHVDGSYGGADSDGTPIRPWTTVQQAVDAAEPGAIVALAAGSYVGGVLVAGKPVRLWGRCPGLVAIVGAGGAVLEIGEGADGTEIHDLALTGQVGWAAVPVHDALEASFDRIWLHDPAGSRGFDVTEGEGSPSVTITRSLIERASVTAIMIWGATGAVEQTVVRDTQPGPTSGVGRALNVSVNSATGTPSTASVHSALFEGSHGMGVGVFSSAVELDSVLVRDTSPDLDTLQASGTGIAVEAAAGFDEPTSVVVRGSVVETSTRFGLYAYGASATIEGTVIRDTRPGEPDGTQGYGLLVEAREEPPLPASATVRFSLIERSCQEGIVVLGSTLELEGVRVRDTLPRAVDETLGLGLYAGPIAGGVRPTVGLHGCAIEGSRAAGMYVTGADATLEDSVVRTTAPELAADEYGHGIDCGGEAATGPGKLVLRRSLVEDAFEAGVMAEGCDLTAEQSVVRDITSSAASGRFGSGIVLNGGVALGAPHSATVRLSRIERTREIGLLVASLDATIEGSVVAATEGEVGDGLFGDDVAVIDGLERGSATILGSLLATSTRAGISCFGSSVHLRASRLECNTIDLDGEEYHNEHPTFEDMGGNTCGCGETPTLCQVSSSTLEPPGALEPPPPPEE